MKLAFRRVVFAVFVLYFLVAAALGFWYLLDWGLRFLR